VLEGAQRDTLAVEKFNCVRRDIDLASPAHPAFVLSGNDLSFDERSFGDNDFVFNEQFFIN
jgi:hypothetical protein